MAVTVRISGLGEVQASLQALVPTLQASIGAGTALLEEAAYAATDAAYEPTRSPYFDIKVATATIGGGTGEPLATLTVACSEPKVLWWEYGTPAHVITALTNRPNPNLRFLYQGAVIFRFRVQNPGVPAHNRRFDLQNTLAISAYALWQDAIMSVIASRYR